MNLDTPAPKGPGCTLSRPSAPRLINGLVKPQHSATSMRPVTVSKHECVIILCLFYYQVSIPPSVLIVFYW
jgi:hypothetical protein